MAQNLTEDLNIVAKSNLEIELLDGDLNIIQKLDDEPNDVGGMTSAELKETFDKAGNIIKDYLNNQLIPAILAADATESARAEAEAARQSAEAERERAETERVRAEEARASDEETRQSNETARKNAETSRENAEKARADSEAQRASAEAERADAERSRVSAEQSRAQAEANRAAAESTRVNNETARIQAESGRVTAEQVRVSAENARKSAEAARSVWEEYNSTKAYIPGNKVVYQGSSYLCVASCTGVTPPDDESKWMLIARKGEDGKGAGDMLASIYDPNGKSQDVFAYADEQVRKHNSSEAKTVHQALFAKKQDKLTGTKGQIVGFDDDGNAVAQELPSGGFVLDSIAITTQATKTTYLKGETFDPSGIALRATYANGATLPVSLSGFEPSGALQDGTTHVTIQYTEGGVTKTAQQPITVIPILTSIAVTTAPTKTVYTYGEAFSANGMVVTATYSDGHTAAVTGYTTSPASFTSVGSKSVTISYTENGYTKTTTQAVTVNKAAGSLSISPDTMTLGSAATTGEITVTREGDGAISAVSSNTNIATVSVSGNKVTVTCGSTAGSAEITVSVAEGTNYTAPASQKCAVTVSFVSSTLNDNSWAVIKSVSDKSEGANYWAVGDTKTITINGKAGATTFSNLSIDAYIIGFNHNSAKEGANRIHFKLGKISGVQVGLVDSSYNSQVSTSGKFTMNTSNTNSGGWNGSHMRKTVLGSDSTPTSPKANTLLAALPSDLRAVMKSVTKYSDNTGGGNNTASYVTATTDYLFLLAEFEVFGTRTYANSAEQNYQAQYDYFKAGNSKVHYRHSATGSTAWAWLRSVGCDGSNLFLIIGTGGTISSGRAAISGAVAPGFAV